MKDIESVKQEVSNMYAKRNNDIFLKTVEGKTQRELADEYGISRTRVRQIILKQLWRGINDISQWNFLQKYGWNNNLTETIKIALDNGHINLNDYEQT